MSSDSSKVDLRATRGESVGRALLCYWSTVKWCLLLGMKLTHEPRRTSEIFARRFLDFGPDETIVSWAEGMVVSGFNSDGLFILLGEIKPFNKFEIDSLLDRIQHELGLPKILSTIEAVEIIATAYVHRFVSGKADSASTLFALTQLYSNEGAVDTIYEFYLLHYAAGDLEIEGFQHYWRDANRGNIEKIILERCFKWMEEHPLTVWHEYECEKC